MIYQVEYKNQNWGCSDIVAASPMEAATIYLQQDSEERWQDYDEIIVSSGLFGKRREFFAIKDLPPCNPDIRAVSDNPPENTQQSKVSGLFAKPYRVLVPAGLLILSIALWYFISPRYRTFNDSKPSSETVIRQVKIEWLADRQKKYTVNMNSNEYVYNIVSVQQTDGRYDETRHIYYAYITYKLKMGVDSEDIQKSISRLIDNSTQATMMSDIDAVANYKDLLTVCNVEGYRLLPNFKRGGIIEISKTFSFKKFDSGWRMLTVDVN